MKRYLLFLFAVLAAVQASAQTTVSLSAPASVKAGTATLPVTVSLAGGGPAGVEFTLAVPADVTAIAPAVSGTASSAAKVLTCNPLASGKLTCIAAGTGSPLNSTAIADGAVAVLTATLVTTPGPSEAFTLSNVLATNAGGSAIAATAGPTLTVPVISKCDVDGSGATDAKDVTLILGWALGVVTLQTGQVGDLNGDGAINLYDVQIVLNAALTGVCNAK